MKDLQDCEKIVNASCNPDNFPQINTTYIDACTALTEEFVEEAGKCLMKSMEEDSAAEGCNCWNNMRQLTEDIGSCKIKTEMDKIKNQVKSCTKAFGVCRKLEDAAVDSLSSCQSATEAALKGFVILNKTSKKICLNF